MYLQFIDLNHEVIGNPNLRPEHSNHFQLSSTWQYTMGQINSQLSLSVLYNEVRDMINLAKINPDPNDLAYTYTNIARVQNIIFIVQKDIDWKDLTFSPGASFTHVFKEEGSTDGFNTIEASANARYLFRQPKVYLSLFYKYTGPTRMAANMPTSKEVFGAEVSGFSMLNASLERSFYNKRINLVLGVKNILDNNTTITSGGIQTGHATSSGNGFLPRSFFATFKYNMQ
jgi:outer membrane receptor for ferrienterochelin and colicins